VRTTRRRALGAATAALVLPAVARADAEEDRAKASLVAVLALEQTALVAYEAIANSGLLVATLRGFLEQEHQHAAQLQTALQNMDGKAPIPPQRAQIAGLRAATRSRAAAARFAVVLEERTIGAYQRAILDLGDPNVIRTSAGAMGADAQQLVVLRELAREPPVPRAFEMGRR
jgi:hypothetical protein